MQISLTRDTTLEAQPIDRNNERGAALLTVLLFSVLLLSAGGALIMTTALSATNSFDATAETQAYYAAEAGMQATLFVLRGNAPPNPLFDTSSPTAAANKLTFRKAVTLSSSNYAGDTATSARLSRWLNYNVATPAGSAIALTSPYSPLSGMAYSTVVEDPDNTANVTYSTLGSFGTDSPSSGSVSYQFGSGANRVTVTYSPQASRAISAGGTTLGTFSIGSVNGTPPIATDPKSTFVITIRQVTSSGTNDVPVRCTIAMSGANAITVTFQDPSPTTNNVLGVTYVHAASTIINANGSFSFPVTVTPPEPTRLKVTVFGHGPRGAKKQMHMLVSRFAMELTANATITIRGADAGDAMPLFTVGSSHPFGYSGFDNSGGQNLPAFVVTNDADLALVQTTITGQPVTGSPTAAIKAPLSDLPLFMQTAQGAREGLAVLRELAKNQYWPLEPIADRSPDTDRYFPSGTTPSTFGSTANPLTTFVDGDCALPPGGGAGLLIVTGVLDMRGSADFKGLILALGAGRVLRNGGGSDITLGAMYVGRFGDSGGFLAPSFDANGAGASQLDYDSKWLEKALMSAGPGVRGVSEY